MHGHSVVENYRRLGAIRRSPYGWQSQTVEHIGLDTVVYCAILSRGQVLRVTNWTDLWQPRRAGQRGKLVQIRLTYEAKSKLLLLGEGLECWSLGRVQKKLFAGRLRHEVQTFTLYT